MKKKIILFIIALVSLLFFYKVEYLIDVTIGDGDGVVTKPGANYLFSTLKTIATLFFLYVLIIKIFGIGWKILLINVSIILLILYLFEWYLYKKDSFLKLPFDSGVYYRDKVKYSFWKLNFDPLKPYITWGNKTRANNYGYRGPDIGEKPDSVFRIAVFGDSFTWGAGLAENERYSNQLDSICKLHYKNVEVVNCGLSGSPTTTERDSIRKLTKRLRANMLIVGFCINDPQPKGENHSIERERFDNKYSASLKTLQTVFASVRLHYLGAYIANGFSNMAEKSGKIPPYQIALGRTYDKRSVEWKNFAQALIDIKAISDSNHCAINPALIIFRQIGLVDFETEKQTEESKKILQIKMDWAKQVFETSKEAGLTTIDSHKSIVNELKSGNLKTEEMPVTPLDGHPSAKMDKLFAIDLYNNIKESFDTCHLVIKK